MAKFYGQGVKTGKLGASVFVVRYGETIERQYQPVVSNPNTEAQVEARAKLKMLSQLSAIMAPIIAIPRAGAVSSRNQFTKVNYSSTSYHNNQADIALLDIKITKGVLSMPPINATRDGQDLNVLTTVGVPYDRVVYCVFVKQADNTLRFHDSKVVTESGAGNYFQATFPASSAPMVVYAYGVRDNNDAATAAFGDLQVLSAETVAKIIVTRVLKETDISLTETVAFGVPSAT